MSNDTPSVKVPVWFWVVGGIALLWNLYGLYQFVLDVTMSPAQVAELPGDHQALRNARPTWVTVAFGVAVIGGVLGCVALLMKKNIALPIFILSLLGILAQNVWGLFMSDMIDVMGFSAMILAIVIIVVAGALVWFSQFATAKEWLT